MSRVDPAGFNRGPLTRWLPVLGQAAPEPPDARPFETRASDTPGRFVVRVIFSIPRITVPAMLLAITWQVGESAVPVVMGLAIDRALAAGDAGQLLLWIGVLVVVYIVLTMAARFTGRLNVTALQLLQHRLRTTLSSRVLHPRHTTVRPPDGGVVSTMTNDVARVSFAVLLLTMSISRIVSIVFIAVSLLVVHWLLGVLVLVGAPVVVFLMGMLSRRLSRSTREYQDLLAATVGRASDLVAGYRVIKGIRAEAEATRRYRQASQETLVGAKRNAAVLGRFLVASGVVNGVFVAAVTGLAGWFAVDGQLSIGGLIATVGLTQALLPQIEGIVGASIPNIASSQASAARILEALGNACPVGSGADAPAWSAGAGTDASERSPDAGVLDLRVSGVPHRVAPGELVGLRADDRTAALVAAALLDPHAERAPGIEIRLGGHPVERLTPAEYHARVTVSPHRMTLFSGTIRSNLTSPSGPSSSADRLDAAVRAAACDDFVTDLDALVGENGNRLSGGQRQRVVLARALATDTPILVLHDPTTAVDSVTEQVIAERLREVRSDRSILLIASTPALLSCCDRVIDLTSATPEAAGDASERTVA